MRELDKLIEAVDAGTFLMDVFPDGRTERIAYDAFSGSLDAAKALHEALLPGCSQYSIVTDPTCLCAKVAWWPDGLSGSACYQGEGWHEANPARAWLLAILRAYRAQRDGQP